MPQIVCGAGGGLPAGVAASAPLELSFKQARSKMRAREHAARLEARFLFEEGERHRRSLIEAEVEREFEQCKTVFFRTSDGRVRKNTHRRRLTEPIDSYFAEMYHSGEVADASQDQHDRRPDWWHGGLEQDAGDEDSHDLAMIYHDLQQGRQDASGEGYSALVVLGVPLDDHM